MKKKTILKIFSRCLVLLLIVTLIVCTIPITFAEERTVTRLEVDDVTVQRNTSGYYTHGEVDGEIVNYYYYGYYNWDIGYTKYYSDGSSQYFDHIEMDDIWINTNQSAANPWDIGEHTATATYYDYSLDKSVSTTFTVTIIDESPVDHIEMEDISVFEETNGYIETDSHENEFYYYTLADNLSYTVYLKNGEILYSDNDGDVYYDDSYRHPEFNLDAQFNDHWKPGENKVKGCLLGCEIEATVRVLENPVDRIEAEDVTLIENTDGYLSGDWVYHPETQEEEYVEYYRYSNIYPTLNIYLKDGSVSQQQISPYRSEIEIDGIKVSADVVTDQSGERPWIGGNTYQASVSLFGKEVDFSVSVIKTPVKSIDVKYTAKGYPYQHGSWKQNYDNGDEWFKYDTRYGLSGTVTMLDGTEIDFYDYSSIYYNGKYYSVEISDDQSYENRWEAGEHEVEVEVLNFKATATYEVLASPVQSADLTVNDIYEGLDSDTSYGYERYSHYHENVSGTITFTDGSTVTLDHAYGFNCSAGHFYFRTIDDQSENNQWKAGTHDVTLTFAGYSLPIQVNLLPNPLKSISAEDVTMTEGLDADRSSAWVSGETIYYDYYNPHPVLHLSFTDGTEQVYETSSSRYIDYKGTDYGYSISTDQSYRNVWSVGNHQATLSVMGKSCDFNVELRENPVKSISVDKVVPIALKNGYSTRDLHFSLNINYKDGTSEQKAVFGKEEWRENEYVNDSRVRVELLDSDNWHLGKGNPFKVTYAGFSVTAYAEIISSKDWEYTETDDGVIITKCNTGTNSVPDTIDGKPVVGVSATAFPKTIRSLFLGDNVRYITGVLNYPELNSLMIGKAFEQFDNETVRYLPALERIYLYEDNENLFCESNVVYTKDKSKVLAAAPACPTLIEINEAAEDIDALSDEIYQNLRYYVGEKSDYFTTVDGVTYTKDMKEVIACDREKSGEYVMPDTVETIRPQAFAGSGLTKVKVSDKVTDIAYKAFINCGSLTSVTLPKNLKSISHQAFYSDSNLSDIQLPSTLESIGEIAFSYCSLASVDLDNSLKSIEYGAFMRNPLTAVTVPDSVEYLGPSAFSSTDITKAEIGDSVKELSYSTFYGCEKLTSVTLGSGVQSIGSNCFTDCEALTDLTIKGSGVSVGTNAFNSCPLTNFTDWDKLGGEIGIGAFRYSGLRQVSLPPTVTSVAYVSFSGCKDLASVSLPDTLLKVDSKAFDGTKWYSDQKDGAVYLNKVFYDVKGQLPENTSLTVKDGTVSLADHALMGHQNLTQITLPKTLKRIGNSEFNRTGVETLDLPASVQEIGDRAFAGAEKLRSIHVDENNPYFTDVDGVLYTKDMTELIYCPYRAEGSFKLPVSVTKIDSFAFADSNVSELTILRDDIQIEPFAFGFEIVYDDSPFRQYGEYYRVAHTPMTVVCHSDSPAALYADSKLLDVVDTEERAFEMGDADGDGETDLVDVTRIQASLEHLTSQEVADRVAADIDRNKLIEIIDATYLQRWLNDMGIPYEMIIKN